MPYYVYILKSAINGSYYYKGSTSDIYRRFIEHNSGKEKSTSRYKPWKLIWSCEKETRSEAIVFEKKLKNIKSQIRTEAFIEKYANEGKIITV